MSRLKNLDVAIYLRKSRADIDSEREAAERGADYDTLDKHRRELLSVAKRDEHNILDIYEEVVSGEYIAERPEMQRLLDNMRALKYDAVLVMDIDRLGRGAKIDQGRIEKAFKDSQTIIITPSDVYDLNEESGEFNVEVRTFLARMEYKQIKKRLQTGRRNAAKSGKDQSTKPPYGYAKDKDKFLVINEDEAKYVRLMYTWCLEGMGRIQIAQRLTEMGVPSPTGKKTWSHVTVRKILSNPKYKGDQVFGRVRWIKQEDGTYITRKVAADAVPAVKIDAHEPIIAPETWDRVQDVIDERRRQRAPLRASYELVNPFAGILRCKKCGNAILANNPKNRPNVYLYCDTQGCRQKMIAVTKVEKVVREYFRQIIDDYERKLSARNSKKDAGSSELLLRSLAAMLRKIDDELEKANKRKSNLHDLLEDGTYDRQTFLERMASVQEKIKELTAQRDEIAAKTAALQSSTRNNSETAASAVADMRSFDLAETAADKNVLLKRFVKEMRYNREPDAKDNEFELEIELVDAL